MTDFYIQKSNKSYGPFSGSDLKKLAKRGELAPDHYVTRADDGKRVKAAEIRGLFEETSTAITRRETEIAARPVRAEIQRVQADELIDCPYCGDEIRATARKCKHCGEYLDGSAPSRTSYPDFAAQQIPVYTPQPMPVVNIVNQVVVNAPHQRRWHKGTAMAFSLLIPGAGQLYKGQLINGLVWFIIVVIGYVPLVIPGIVLHLLCILGAGMGDEYR